MSHPPRYPVPLAWPWRVVWQALHVDDPDALPPDDEEWGWFTESLLLAGGPGGVGIEIGWLPDGDPNGRFQALLLPPSPDGGFDWRAPLEVLFTRDAEVAVRAVVDWSERYAEPLPTDAHALAAALAPHYPAWAAPTLTRLLPADRRAALIEEVEALAPYFEIGDPGTTRARRTRRGDRESSS